MLLLSLGNVVIWCNGNIKVFKYFLKYYRVNVTIVLYIKQESLEIIELKDQCLNIRGEIPLPHLEGVPNDVTGVTSIGKTPLIT